MVEIKTIDGIAHINVEKLTGIIRRKLEGSKNYSIELIQGQGFIHIIEVNTLAEMESAIEKLSHSQSSDTIEPKGYIDGFKDGCEYTLNLKETK